MKFNDVDDFLDVLIKCLNRDVDDVALSQEERNESEFIMILIDEFAEKLRERDASTPELRPIDPDDVIRSMKIKARYDQAFASKYADLLK